MKLNLNPFNLRFFQIILFLLAAVPCGIPYRYQPNPVFPSELAAFIFASLLVLGAVFVPRRDEEPVVLPWASLIWFGLAGVVGLQYWFVDTPYLCERTVPMLYFGCAGLSVWALARAKAAYGAQALVEALAWGLLAGTLFNSGVGFSQLIDLFQHGWRLIYGHIGQKNMYGHYLAWGLAACAWLAAERKLPQWAFWPLAVWLALSMAWSSSRSVFLYALAWLPLAGFIAWRGRDNLRRFGCFLGASALLIIAMQFVAPLINDAIQAMLKAGNEAPTGVDRLASNGSRRLVEWEKAWMTFLQHPLLGVGWGAYAAQSVILHVLPDFARVQESVLFTHSHNSLLNLMAETGILGAGIVVAGIVWIYAALLRYWKDPIAMFAMALATVSILHSLVEYPLWYYHLFGPFVLMLLFIRSDGIRLPLPQRGLQLGFAATAGGLIAVAIAGGMLYLKIYPIMDPADDEKTNAANIRMLEQLRRHPLLDFYGAYALSNYIVASDKDITWKLAILRPLNSIRPYPGQMTDQAVLEALSGNKARAHELIRQAAYAYPESFDYFYQTLERFPQPAVQELRRDVDEAYRFFGKKPPQK